MADEREITITIRGKNLTPEAFAQARKDLAGVSGESQKATGSTSALGQAFKALGPALSVAAITGAASKILDYAGKINDLAAQTGLSTRAIQEMAHAAKQTGTSVEAFTNAAFKLGTNLAGGSDSVQGAVERLGLSYLELRKQSPDQQFNTIAAALGGVQNAQERNKLAVELFGKAAKEILPAIAQGYDLIATSAFVAGDMQINALDQAGDALSTFWQAVMSGGTQLLGGLVITGREVVRLTGVMNDLAEMGQMTGTYLEAAGFKTMVLPKVLNEARVVASGMPAPIKAMSMSFEELTKFTKASDDQIEKSIEGKKKLKTELVTAHKALADWNEEVNTQNANFLRNMASLSDFTAAVEVHTKRVGQAVVANAVARRGYENELDTLVKVRTLSRVELEIDAIDRWASNEKLKLDQSVSNWRAAAAAIDAVAKEKMTALRNADDLDQLVLFANLNTDATKRVRALNIAAKTAAYDGLASFFTSLGQIAGSGGIGQVLGSVGSMIVGFKSANDQGNQLGRNGERLGGSFGSLSTAFNSNATGAQKFAAGVQAAGAIAQGAIAIWDSASAATTRLGAAFNGAMAGAQAGAAFGPWGAAAGAAVGVVASLFQDKVKKAVQAANVEIDKIKTGLIATHGPMDELQAKAERVGLSFKDNWGHQGAAGLKAMQEMAKQLEDRLRLVGEASGKAIAGFASVATEMTRGYLSVGQAVRDAQAEVYKLDTAVNQDRLTQALTAQHAAASGARQGLADLGTQAVATFAAAMLAGASYSEAIGKVGPSIATLGQAYKDLGLDVDDVGLKHLILQSTVATGNPALIAATSGLGQSMQGLAQLGLLNVDTFAAMQRTGMAMYARLQGAVSEHGGTSRDALLPMQDYLHQAAIQAELLGIPLDANTAMLIEQSKELGIWKEKGKSANDLLIEGLDRLVGAVGELLSRMLGVSGAITGLPARTDVEVNITTNEQVFRTVEETVGQRREVSEYASGTFGVHGLDFPDFGSGTRAVLHDREAVVPYADRVAFADRVLGGSGASPQASPITVNLLIDKQGNARAVGDEEFIIAAAQRGLDSARISVPQRAIAQRSR